jgi:hypothetical protein
MTEEKKSPTITELIDADEGLKSKRKILTITSLILLALTFSGAKVEEANTFILKLKFDNQNGIAILLVLTIVFLIIRYYNYAKPYHEKLFRAWSDRMLDDGYFLNSDVETRELFGLVARKAPKGFDIDGIPYGNEKLIFIYKCLFLRRELAYRCPTEYGYEWKAVGIGFSNYLKVYRLELKYQLPSFFTHRENLDILAPYVLGVVAILSYFFHEQLQVALTFLSVK